MEARAGSSSAPPVHAGGCVVWPPASRGQGPMLRRDQRPADLRRRVYEILEQGPVGDRTSYVVDRLIILLIVVNLIAVALESMPELGLPYGTWFETVELASLVVFTVEYGLLLWVAPEHTPRRHYPPLRARW